jgi:hypothetical protein
VTIVQHTFPSSQVLAGHSTMTVAVRNDGSRNIPDVAVTVSIVNWRIGAQVVRGNGFNYISPQPGLADPNRPVWIVNQGPGLQPSQKAEGNYSPGAGVTAYTNTWALGSLPPQETRTFSWDVTAMMPGQWTIGYRVAAGLNGKARAEDGSGGIPQGSFQVNISRQAPQSQVDPNTGRVIRSPPAVAGGKKGGAHQSGSGGGSQPSSGAGSGGTGY